jgi:3-oxoacyl-[acyl-carrier-protein] synthase-3
MIAYLRGVSYALGETEISHADIPRLPELAAGLGLAMNPALWGWGSIRVAASGLPALAARSAAATMTAAGLVPGAVDALVCCATRVPGTADDHGCFAAKILTSAGLGDIAFYGQNLNRCLNLLTGLDVAAALVRSGRHRHVLVVTTDAVAPGAAPLSRFALYSDGAASCLVSSDAATSAQDCYEIVGCATAQDVTAMDAGAQISSDLARVVNDKLLGQAGLKVGDIAAVAHLNLFVPLVVMKERQAGFGLEQLYTENIPRFGHCFAADPLINLADRVALGHVGTGRHCLLAASVPGARAGVLLRRVR